jgi:hypothetical protein
MRQNYHQRTVTSQDPKSQFLRFLLWANLKGKVYKNNPRSIEALQDEITRVIGSITVDELQKVSQNLFIYLCDAMRGMFASRSGHFQHLL